MRCTNPNYRRFLYARAYEWKDTWRTRWHDKKPCAIYRMKKCQCSEVSTANQRSSDCACANKDVSAIGHHYLVRIESWGRWRHAQGNIERSINNYVPAWTAVDRTQSLAGLIVSFQQRRGQGIQCFQGTELVWGPHPWTNVSDTRN